MDAVAFAIDALRGIVDALKNGVFGFIQRLGEAVGASGNALLDQNGFNLRNLVGQILGVAKSLPDAIRGALDGMMATLGNIASTVASLPADVRDFAGRVGDAVQNLAPNLAHAITDQVPAVLANIVGWLVENWQVVKDLAAFLLPDIDLDPIAKAAERLMRGEMSAQELITAGTPRELQTPFGHHVWNGILLAGLIVAVVTGSGAVPGETVRQELNILAQNQVIPIGAAAELQRRELADPDFVDEIRQRQGYSETEFFALGQAATSELAPGQIIELFNRLGRDEGFLAAKLRHSGLHERDIPLARALADTLPPPSDLIRFAVREVFTPGIAEKFGQFQEVESLPVDRFNQLGISEQHMKEYWAAHWELPSLSAGYDMYHRTADTPIDQDSEAVQLSDGTTVYRLLGLEGLKSLQRAQDVMPFWRERLEKLAFHPLTRVDIRRLHKEGILTAAGVERAYLDNGYSPENARRLMDFTVALNSQDDEELIRSIRAPIATKALASYVKLYSTREETEKLLTDLGFEPVQIRFQLTMADHDRAVADADAAASAARTGYVSGTYNADDVRVLLGKQKFKPAAIDRLLDAWDVARFTRDLSDAEKAQRDLTKSEILAAYSDKVIARDEAGPLLIVTGYDAEEADVLLAVEDAKAAKADTAALVAATHADFVAGKLDRKAAVGELDKWGVATKRRDALLRAWDLERGQREAHISVSDLKAMADKNIVSPKDITEQLIIQGFGDKQINWYLQLWGKKPDQPFDRRRLNG